MIPYMMPDSHLTPQQDRTWNLLVGVMMWLPAELDAFLQRTTGLSHCEYQVLRWLSASEEREIHMSRLAATANVTPSHLSRIVARLEKQGCLTRSTDLADARKTLARLTDAGALIVEETEPAYVAEVRRHVFDRLDQQAIEQLETLTETILTPLRSDCVAVLPPRNSHEKRAV